MPVNFSGTWTEVHYEGWGGLLESMNIDQSKLPADMRMTETIRQSDDDNDTLVIVTTNNKDAGFRKEVTIKVGSNFTDSVKGRPFECTTAWQGDKLVLTGVDGRGGVTRELLMGGQMLVTIKVGENVAKTFFEKQ